MTTIKSLANAIATIALSAVSLVSCDMFDPMIPVVEPETPVGVEMVDLGLSVKWANMNVGATCGTTADSWYGAYFAWGETQPKYTYGSDNYAFYLADRDYYTKYCISSSEGALDMKYTLDAYDDAATANWGAAWRMPTGGELEELYSKCTWIWTDDYQGIRGLNGYVVSAANGNSIFLPAAGNYNNFSLEEVGSACLYWSASLGVDSRTAFGLYFDNYGEGRRVITCHGRTNGRVVRPVCY